MIILIDTSTPVCRLWLVARGQEFSYEWDAGRSLARDLLGYLRDRLSEHDAGFADITGIGVYQGPGSFTGLRIGMTVMNSIAQELDIPIVGATTENWRKTVKRRLAGGETDRIVLPEYGGDAHITRPRK